MTLVAVMILLPTPPFHARLADDTVPMGCAVAAPSRARLERYLGPEGRHPGTRERSDDE